ncbi:uncharacterized protein LOC114524522 [Dendronephthya gigantea]|uniref:uncharacterized protein LOC114524522 n=1 Tax=Dendronephthya gigantea TaxID=151771 RepID=UPI00106AC39C|nr:uncharacterized protein LOC114524522 [Dendronephthya gigantea]
MGMEEKAYTIVYGSEFLCTFNQVSEPIARIVLKILEFKDELLDMSKLLSHSEDISTEIEQIGRTFVTLAQKLQGLAHEREAGAKKEAEYAQENVDTKVNQSQDLCDRTSECDIFIEQLEVSLINEQQKNDILKFKIHELSLMQEERLKRIEEQVAQAESVVNERLKVKKLDKRKGQMQNVLKSGQVHSRHSKKNEQNLREGAKSPTPWIQALPPCHTQASDQGYQHRRVGTPVPPRTLREKKEELQLKEEVKWSRITPMPVNRTRKKNQRNLPLPEKRS